MAILRNPKQGKFTVLDNYALRDNSLSLKARGLLAAMLSFPDNWEFSENGLCAVFKKDGQASIRSGLKELEERGYLTKTRTRDKSGRVSSVEWTVYDYPRLENPSVVNPNLENRPQLNTKESNTDSIKDVSSNPPVSPRGGTNTPEKRQKRFVPPTVEEVRTYCLERQNAIDAQRFVDYYTANGWAQGRGKPIKDWRAAVRTWEARDQDKTRKVRTSYTKTPTAQDYDMTHYLTGGDAV